MPIVRIPAAPAKYRSQWTEYAGVKFQSKREAAYCAELDLRVRTGELRGYRRQVRLPLFVNDVKICTIVVDFVVEHRDGTHEFVDVKGFPTEVFKLKWKLFSAVFPQLRKTIVK